MTSSTPTTILNNIQCYGFNFLHAIFAMNSAVSRENEIPGMV